MTGVRVTVTGLSMLLTVGACSSSVRGHPDVGPATGSGGRASAGVTPAKPASPAISAPRPATLTDARNQLAGRLPGDAICLVAVGSAYEAAAYDRAGHVSFWRDTDAVWRREAEGNYPPPADPRGAVRMYGYRPASAPHAVFILHAPFSASGGAGAVAYGDGPRGWGTFVPTSASTLTADPRGLSGRDERGLWQNVDVGSGLLRTWSSWSSRVLPTVFTQAFPVIRSWRWAGDGFVRVRTNTFTATVPTFNRDGVKVPPLPAAPAPDGTYGVIGRVQLGERGVELVGHPSEIHSRGYGCRPSGCLACQPFCRNPMRSKVTIPLAPDTDTKWMGQISMPAWMLAAITEVIRDQGSDVLRGADFNSHDTPYYVPPALDDEFDATAALPAVAYLLTVRGGRVVAVTALTAP